MNQQPPNMNPHPPASAEEMPEIPTPLIEKWQGLTNALAELLGVKAISITRSSLPDLEIIVASQGEAAPFKAGDHFSVSGHYCEAVLRHKRPLLIQDAAHDPRWRNSLEVKTGLQSYFGCPLLWPQGKMFGSLCIFGTEPYQIQTQHEALMSHLRELLESQLASQLRESQTEQALEQQEAQVSSILRAAPIGIGLLCQRNFQRVNEQFCEMTGYSHAEVIGESARLLYTTDQEYERVGRDKYGQIERLGTGTVETRWLHKDGHIIDVLLSSTPLDPGDLSMGVTFTALDITERNSYQSRLRSLAQQLSIAEERERRRVAVGVHDDIGQKLVLVKLELQSLQQTLDPGPATESLDRVCEMIDITMQEARTLAFDLSNPVLYEVGFDAAVESWLTRQVKEIAGINYSFDSQMGRVKLEETTQVVLFRAVREILTNVIKHAHAQAIQVHIDTVDCTLRVRIQDDGIGFDPARLGSGQHQEGLGLFNVRERLEFLGGELLIDSVPGQGCTVMLCAPLASE